MMTSRNTTILFAEDDEPLRSGLSRILQKNGYSVIVAKNGLEALEKAKQHSGAIHILVSNIDMPDMSGIEVARQIRSYRPQLKVLLISGRPAGLIALDEGCHFLPKPFLSQLLIDRIESILQAQGGRNILGALPGDPKQGSSPAGSEPHDEGESSS